MAEVEPLKAPDSNSVVLEVEMGGADSRCSLTSFPTVFSPWEGAGEASFQLEVEAEVWACVRWISRE